MPPLNAVIHSVVESGRAAGAEVVGLAGGWQGLLDKKTVDLNNVNIDPLIGGTILKSSRVNLAKVDGAYRRITDNLSELHLDGLIVVGGEDTLSNAFHLRDIPQVLISKTIDNDVGMNGPGGIVNYFTLGYPTAAEKISSFVSLREGLRTTAYSHERIIVVESMGMHAGWLAISSAMGHPDFIIVPEFPLDYPSLLERVIERYRQNRNVIVVVSEGARWSSGDYISADEMDKDAFGHPKFKGAAEVLAKKLKTDLEAYFDVRNINSVNPSYLYRSGKPNKLDIQSASILGRDATKLVLGTLQEPVLLILRKEDAGFVTGEYFLKELHDIEGFHRFVDARFYSPKEFGATPEAMQYLSDIVPDLGIPPYGLSND